jgi:hypothetical protein
LQIAIYKNGQIIAILQIAILKNGQIITILQLLKFRYIRIFGAIHVNVQLILLIAIYKTAKLLHFCELQFIKKRPKLQKAQMQNLIIINCPNFVPFFSSFCNLQQMPAIGTLHQNCLAMADVAAEGLSNRHNGGFA